MSSKKDANNFKDNVDEYLHYLMSCMGGFFGVYALSSAAARFASAQTGNLMEMAMDLVKGEWLDLILGILALIFFAGGILVSFLLGKYRCGKQQMKKLCLWIDAAGLVISVTFALLEMNPMIVLYPVFFVTAFQWSTYTGAAGFNSATLFSTNNLKQCVTGFAAYAVEGKQEDKRKGIFYISTLCAFTLGAFLAAACDLAFGITGGLIGLVILAIARVLIIAEERAIKREETKQR